MENPILRVLVPDMTMDGSVWDWDNTEVGDVTREKTEGFRLGLFVLSHRQGGTNLMKENKDLGNF